MEHISIISHDRRQIEVSVAELENLLSPALFATGERPAVIVPIKPDYAEELFSGSTQRSLLHHSRAILLNEKRYFSNRRTYRIIPENGLIVFYESGGRGGRSAEIAIGRTAAKARSPTTRNPSNQSVPSRSPFRETLNHASARKGIPFMGM